MIASLIVLSVLGAKPNASFQPKNRPYDAIAYRLDVKIVGEDDAFNNKLTLTLKPKRALTEVELDAYNLEIQSVTVDGAPATFKTKADVALRTGTLTLKPAKALAANKEAKLEITYAGKAQLEHQGLFKVEGAGPEQLPAYFTMFEPYYAQQFFPNNDDPADKALTEVHAIVDSRYTVLSNGRKEKDEVFTEGGKNLRRVSWRQDQPMSTYLVALAIGGFEGLDVGGDTPATVWVRPGSQDRAFVAQDSTRAIIAAEVAYTGVKFPWAKADQVAVPRFFWGGMENTSLIFNRESNLVLPHKNDIATRPHVVGLIAHEMAHQWFGDYVTCKWWDDTWLNEGFATWLGPIAEDQYLDSDYVEVQRAWSLMVDYFHDEDGPRSHPLVGKNAPSPEEVFDGVSYEKGAQVLRMLELWLGKPEMKKAIKAYLEKYAHQNATSDDFFKVVFDSSKKGKELQPFKDSWLKKRGYPVITPETSFADGKLTVTIRQTPNHLEEKGPFVFKLPIVIHRENEPRYTQEAMITVDANTVTTTIDVPAAPEWINWNRDLGALTKVNPSAVSEEQWVNAARHDPDPVWRTLAAWTLLGELGNPAMTEETRPTDAAFGAVLDVLSRDGSPYVREAVLNKLRFTRWKKLPAELGPPVLKLAKRPDGMPEDPIGMVLVRKAAMSLLGKIDYPEGRQYVLAELVKKDVDINYLPGFARAAALIATDDSIGVLRAAVTRQKDRGYAFYKPVAEALMSTQSPTAMGPVMDEIKANLGNAEIMRFMIWELNDNFVLKTAPEFPGRIRDLVLDDKGASLDVKMRLLGLLDDVKTKEAKEALNVIADKSPFERTKGMAKQLLDANFKVAEAAPKKK
ncbi:MAG: M1 family metallopeptidase [Archangiaceae bacterium]|nr:M1 family metallopeptidase [Archangiaceae bacterium]